MAIKIGSPKGLYYYSYFTFIKTFFKELGIEIIFSPDTDKAIFEEGLMCSESELCLPVKTYIGHVSTLSRLVDMQFVFSYASIERKKWTCPKIMMANQMAVIDNPKLKLLELPILIRNSTTPVFAFRNIFRKFIGSIINIETKMIDLAFAKALKNQMQFQKNLIIPKISEKSRINIAVIGHPYVLWDNYLNMNIFNKLAALGISYATTDNIAFAAKRSQVKKLNLPREMSWTPCEEIMGSALHFASQPDIDGIIFLSMFGCGFDPISEELISDYIKRSFKKPFIKILIDEHTSQVNFDTKLSAFTDTIMWTKNT